MRRRARTDLLRDLDLLKLTERLSFLTSPRDSGESTTGDGARFRGRSFVDVPPDTGERLRGPSFAGVPPDAEERL